MLYFFASEAYWYVLLSCKGYFKVSCQIEVTYWSDDSKVWLSARIVTSNLIWSLPLPVHPCATARHLLFCNFDCFCSNQRTCKSSCERIFALIQAVSLYAWHHKISGKLFAGINVNMLYRAYCLRLSSISLKLSC